VMVVAAFDRESPATDLGRFEEDLLLADMEIVSGRIERLRDSVKKPRPNREQEMAELAALEQVLAAMEAGKPLAETAMTEEQLKATRSFRLLTEKPSLVILNVADDEADPAARAREIGVARPVLAVRVGIERELARMTVEERAEFERDLGLTGSQRDEVLRAMLDVSGQMLYFTAGEKEVRTWMFRKGGTALEAADNVHSDLARGFIRAEVMTCRDLVRLGSEREIKAHNLVRQEPKDYVVQDDDILNIRFSV
jgi:ribosome-binding ATPase YchF (GTP1/OBG family)